MGKKKLLDFIAVLDERKDGCIINQVCAILYRYMEKRGRLPGRQE